MNKYYVEYNGLHEAIELHDFEDLLRESELKYDLEHGLAGLIYTIYGENADIELTLSKVQ